jgi:hypothetical protein
MKRFLLCVLVCALATSAFAVDGVIVKERIVNLPNDQVKWYLSVVGDPADSQYATVVNWFKSGDLKKLRNQVHYREIAKGTAAYNERYARNIKGLPTVRLQDHEGVVIYEAAGTSLPMTSGGLYGALADGVMAAQGITFGGGCPFGRPCPKPNPQPDPAPDPVPDEDPEPEPIVDGGAPVVEPTSDTGVSGLLPIIAAVLSFLGGIVAGVAVEWKKTHAVE